MNIVKATRDYETWLGRHTRIFTQGLELKHQRMADNLFCFLRATFYRWMQLWPEICPDLDQAPKVLTVGDLHVENFGTWRDVEGRLVWGVNDFDEVYPLPYTVDLVRLAASTHVAIAGSHLRVQPDDGCVAILKGYRLGLEKGGHPFVLANEHVWLRNLATNEVRDPVRFWKRTEEWPTARGRVPADAIKALEKIMPEPGLDYKIVHRVAGLGSLGRERYVALAEWRGGRIAREAKAMVISACVWAAADPNNGRGSRRLPQKILYQTMLDQAVRCPDPFVRFKGRWIVRRLAPDCSRIELASLPRERDETRLLEAMGLELANIHLGSAKARNLLRDLEQYPPSWLHNASRERVMAAAADWEDWRKNHGSQASGDVLRWWVRGRARRADQGPVRSGK